MGRKRITLPKSTLSDPIARSGLHEAAADHLRRMIVEQELEPGSRLGEKALSELLGISRTPLREGLKLLAAEGLVDLVPNKGARVALLDAREIHDLFEAAAGIERAGAELAAERLSDGEIGQLNELQARIEIEFDLGNRRQYFELNQEIHRTIVAGSKNEVLIATHNWLFPRLERARYQALGSESRWRVSVEEHRDILAAIGERQSERAGRLLAAHVLQTGRSIIDRLQERSAA